MAAGDPILNTIRDHIAAADWLSAEAGCRAVLERNPKHLETLNLLAGTLCEQGKYADAAVVMKPLIEAQPRSVPALRNLASLYRMAEMHAESAATYSEICGLDPRDAASLNHLGVARLGLEEFDTAAEAFEAATKLLPQHGGVRRNLADALLRAERFAEAVPHYEKALQIASDDGDARLGLARSVSHLGQFARAAAEYQQLLRSDSSRGELRGELATALHSAGRLDEAERHARQVIEEFHQNPLGYLVLGNVERERAAYPEAVSAYQKAIAIDPDNANARYNLGLVYTELGDFDAAIRELEKAIGINPRFAAAYYLLGDLASQDKFQFSDGQLATVRELIGDGASASDDASDLGFALAGVLEKQGRFDEAFATYAAANDHKYRVAKDGGQAFNPIGHRDKIDRTIVTWNAEYFASGPTSGLDTEVPTFVVGMPRSGTTLVEQIVAAHRQAAGVGELTDIASLAVELRKRLGGKTGDVLPPADASPAMLAELADRYLTTITERAGTDGPAFDRIVDKTPGNSAYLGVIASLFPKARIIECRRDVRDICLSCYFRNLFSLDWTWRLDSIGHVYNGYVRLMRHWHDVLPLEIFVVDYEQLIREPESTSRSLIEFCGLPWDDACLEFYKGTQAVRTASRVQVRRPIYNTSVERWRNYADHLGELDQVLEQG